MPYEEAHESPELRAWLLTTLEPMCDADPEVMADYIIALLKHDATFSEQEWKDFCARELEDFLESNSVPFVNALFDTLRTKSYLPPAAVAAPTPAVIQPVSAYRPSVAPEQPQAGPSSPRRSQNGDDDVAMVEREVAAEVPAGTSGKQKCFDYHEKGYCMRGATCPYEHSADVIIPTPEMMFQQFPFMNQNQRGRGGFRGRGRGRGGMPPMGMPNGFPPPPFPAGPQNGFPPNGFNPGAPPFQPGMPMMPGNFPRGVSSDSEYFGVSKPPTDRSGTTLVVTDIPPAKLSVPAIREHFIQFGPITNIAIEGRSSRALVSFETNKQAFHAWNSDTPVFDSRKVKVLWHRPRPGQGGAGMEALEASKNLLQNMNKLEGGGGDIQGAVKPELRGPESRLKATLLELENAEKRGKREKLMAEQKVLLKRAGESSQEEKVVIVSRLKVLMKELEELKKEKKGDDKEPFSLSDKEKLDRELEKHGMETSAGKDQDELLKLSAQLSALRDKATTLGIPATRYSPYSRGAPRGTRARGRGRGASAPRPMRLDNRSRSVLLTGDFLTSDTAKQAAQSWFESTGGSIAPSSGGMVVSYPSRELAEKALALGTGKIELDGKGINAVWHSDGGGAVSGGGGGESGGGAEEVEMVDTDRRRGEDMDDD